MRIEAPHSLSEHHDLSRFTSTAPELDRWLRERGLKNQSDGASRCFVVAGDERHVLGYYALAAGSVSRVDVPGAMRRNMPDPIPVAVLGRLAVHRDWTARGLGAGLLKDAVLRTARISDQLGIRALLCHARDEDAKAFYLRHGFVASAIDPMTLMLGMARVSISDV